MLKKRILILEQTDSLATVGKELCGMVKACSDGKQTQISVFVSNLNARFADEWWLLTAFGVDCSAFKLQNPCSQSFSVENRDLDAAACLLVGVRDGACREAASGFAADSGLVSVLRRKRDELIFGGGSSSTAYEAFVESGKDYYDGFDLEKLKRSANERYKCVEDYSSAFERYYATDKGNDYYQSVKDHICKIFMQFPPYYPLINKYSDSFFVKIDFPSSDKYFVMGVLSKEGAVRYICYGLPATEKEFSDKDFSLVSDGSRTFWMLFQDAQTGQITVLK